MSTLREAAQQALEAMESCSGVPHWPALQPTVTALRVALAQQEQEPVAGVVLNAEGRAALVEHGREQWHVEHRGAGRLYTHPPRREQEPVARVIALENTPSVRLEWFDTKAAHNAKPGLLYNVEEVLRQSVSCRLVNNPPRREWQGLTEEEREQATGWSVEHIEAALKNRNT